MDLLKVWESESQKLPAAFDFRFRRDLRCLDARAAELRAAIFETGQSQAELVEHLRAVTNTQASASLQVVKACQKL